MWNAKVRCSVPVRAIMAVAAALALFALSTPAQARPGFFFGLGLISNSETGDMNGSTVLANPGGTEAIYVGKQDDATGVGLDVGYGFNRFVGLEYWADVVNSSAHHQALNYSSATTTASQNVGLRLSLPVGASVELFLRGGIGAYAVQYETFATPSAPGSAGAKSVLFAGEGQSTGGGVELYSGHVGFGLSYTVHNVQYNKAQVQGESGQTLSKSLDAQIAATELTLSYHF